MYNIYEHRHAYIGQLFYVALRFQQTSNSHHSYSVSEKNILHAYLLPLHVV